MFEIINNEAVVTWDGKTVVATVYPREIEALKAIKGEVDMVDYWTNAADKTNDAKDKKEYEQWEFEYQVKARAMCEIVNCFMKPNVELKWFMF